MLVSTRCSGCWMSGVTWLVEIWGELPGNRPGDFSLMDSRNGGLLCGLTFCPGVRSSAERSHRGGNKVKALKGKWWDWKKIMRTLKKIRPRPRPWVHVDLWCSIEAPFPNLTPLWPSQGWIAQPAPLGDDITPPRVPLSQIQILILQMEHSHNQVKP